MPPLSRKSYTGGVFGLLMYADGLAKRGHEVNVVPMLPSPEPAWFRGSFRFVTSGLGGRLSALARASCRLAGTGLGYAARQRDKAELGSAGAEAVARLLLSIDRRLFSFEIRRAASLLHLRDSIPAADVTMATSFETALPTSVYGSGRKFYFAQHFEPYFKGETDSPALAEIDALTSYRLGLRMIANSTWLKNKIESEVKGARVELCLNAIDHGVFYATGQIPPRPIDSEVIVISYGGRDAEWKGFREMAEAVSLARKSLPDVNLRWQVYGDALLPPNNEIAPYEPLGFLVKSRLADAYRAADIMLSASWYESFPAFPLEAMACGLPVITTPYGTEDYAIPGETAEVVEPRDPAGIARGLLRLIRDRDYRASIATRGSEKSRELTWEKSAARLEEILVGWV